MQCKNATKNAVQLNLITIIFLILRFLTKESVRKNGEAGDTNNNEVICLEDSDEEDSEPLSLNDFENASDKDTDDEEPNTEEDLSSENSETEEYETPKK